MLNKLYKITHNKYSKIFNFIFFLRYLITIFFITTVLFLIIPNFFDYEQRVKLINNHLIEKYNYKISGYEYIKFKSLPIPNIEFKNAKLGFESSTQMLKVKKMSVYPNLLSIYNYETFQSNKLVLEGNNITSEIQDVGIKKII